MTGVREEMPYCSPGISSGKQKKARSFSQPQFRSENTPATTEADQILLARQQLATNSYSVNFSNNVNKISKLLKSLTTTMPIFDRKSEKIALFKDLSRQVSKSTINLQKKTKKCYTLPCEVMHWKHSKTSPAPTDWIWEKVFLCFVKDTWNLNQWLQQTTNFNVWSSSQGTKIKLIFETNSRN